MLANTMVLFLVSVELVVVTCDKLEGVECEMLRWTDLQMSAKTCCQHRLAAHEIRYPG